MLPLDYFLFLQIILFLFITPGTPRIVIISYAMNYGTKNCIWIALGDITANLIQATLVIFFIGSFIANNSETLNILKWFGIAYLFYLSYDIYKSSPPNFNKASTKSKKLLSFFKDGFIVAGTSPKAWIFFPLIFPQFINFPSNLHETSKVNLELFIIDVNENTWEFKDGSGTILYSGGPYEDAGIFNHEFDVIQSECYTFTIYDLSLIHI